MTDLILESPSGSVELSLPEGWTSADLTTEIDSAFDLSDGTFSDDPVKALTTPGQSITYTAGESEVAITVTGEFGVWEMISGAYPRLTPLIEAADLSQYTQLSDDDLRSLSEHIGKVLDPIIEEVSEQDIDFPQVPVGSTLQTVPVAAGFTGKGEAEQAASSLVKLLISAELVKYRRDSLKPTNLGEACLDRDVEYVIALEQTFPWVFNANEQVEAIVSTLFAYLGQNKAGSLLGVDSRDVDNAYSEVIHEITGNHVTPTSTLNRDLRTLLDLEKVNPLVGTRQPTAAGKKLMGYLLAQI
ncbi:hypothetical protein [Corynebacterium lubricantis]|uniref:hypothetical protein n=1 Tax=Corynebacterium lubricantis TaxID=541095 RepID=UPI0003791758|nr:hypothetical protein [Corynebacterium lubricantis]